MEEKFNKLKLNMPKHLTFRAVFGKNAYPIEVTAFTKPGRQRVEHQEHDGQGSQNLAQIESHGLTSIDVTMFGGV